MIILIIVGVLVLAGGIWYYQSQKEELAPPTSQQSATPSIVVLSPNGGEVWEIGKSYDILWKTSKFSSEDIIGIELGTTNQPMESRIAIADSRNTGKYKWTIPSTIKPDKYYIHVFIYGTVGPGGGEKIEDFSDASFSIVAAISQDETANWKTYRNSKYGFEMRYPNDWLIEGNQDSVYFKRTDISQEEMERKQIGYPLSILIENTSAGSILDWFENEFSDRAQDSRPEKHLITIGGVNGIKYSDPISMGGCDGTFATIKNGKLFRFLRHGSTCGYSDELFTNIISTFKFVE